MVSKCCGLSWTDTRQRRLIGWITLGELSVCTHLPKGRIRVFQLLPNLTRRHVHVFLLWLELLLRSLRSRLSNVINKHARILTSEVVGLKSHSTLYPLVHGRRIYLCPQTEVNWFTTLRNPTSWATCIALLGNTKTYLCCCLLATLN